MKNENKRMPTRLAEVEPIEPAFPAAYLGLIHQDIVYVWGMPLNSAASDKVLAFEKKTDAEGGWVLMQDGSVKRMTQEEFAAAGKARS